jgi:metallophosphoesterase (TIGR00282 family)
VKILFVGDIVGKAGRKAARTALPKLFQDHRIDLTIANGENAAGGFGITPKIAENLLSYDIDLLTSGNHIWDKKDIIGFLDETDVLLRPANYPDSVPGRGSALIRTKTGLVVGVINVSGRVFMDSLDCPFRVALEESEKLKRSTPVLIVDFHAEATSEKEAFGWFMDGHVSAVVGTHTHVQTADERILPKGTAYITDAGMSGSMDSVIGIKKDVAIERFLKQIPNRFEAAKDDVYLQGVIVEVDEKTGRSEKIERFSLPG